LAQGSKFVSLVSNVKKAFVEYNALIIPFVQKNWEVWVSAVDKICGIPRFLKTREKVLVHKVEQ
jgi:hypothetical protein